MAAASQQRQQQRKVDKELRGNIRGLLSRAKHDKHNLISVKNNRIVEIVQESNQYVEKVRRPRDQAVDAELFSFVTEAGLEYVSRLKQGGLAFTAGDFIRRLKVQHVADTDTQAAGAADPEAINWAGLGQLPAVAVLFRSAPVVHHMLGPMDAQPRQRRQVQRQAKCKAPVGEVVRPEEVGPFEDTEKQETDRNMEEMWHVLHAEGGRTALLGLVINHSSFSQTVENLFTLSFLVRDNKVVLEENEEEGITVVQRPAVKGSAKEKSHEAERMQFVIPLDIETWELWKRATDASKPPMMKHRREFRQHVQQEEQQQQQEETQEEEEQPHQRQQGQQQANQQVQQGQQQQPVKQEPLPAAAASGADVAAEIINMAGTSEEDDATPQPPCHHQQQQVAQTRQVTQLTTQGTHSTQRMSGPRLPKRSRRA